MTTTSARMQQNGYTAAQWTVANTVLAVREIGLELDTGRWKFGDGTTPWTSLPYVFGKTELVAAVTAQGDPFKAALDAAYVNTGELTAYTGFDNRYYTQSALTGGQLDSRYYTQTQLNNGQLDARYDARYVTPTALAASTTFDKRYLLTAGTSNIAQTNLPFRDAGGTVSMPASTSTGTNVCCATTTIAFPTGRFTATPYVTLGVHSSDTNNLFSATVTNVTTAGFTLNVVKNTASFGAGLAVDWHARVSVNS